MQTDNRTSRKPLEDVLSAIAQLPEEWHLAGSVSTPVLRAIVRHVGRDPVRHSMETGSGKTTLLFSQLSESHKVFAEEGDNRSITVVRESRLLRPEAVEFIDGPTQVTLPRYRFQNELQVALIDGPHAYPFPDLEYYYVYPWLGADALLIVDDIHIPTIRHLFDFLSEDQMFRLVEVVDSTAFFRRTTAPLFDPLGDGWELQAYNTNRYPVDPASGTMMKTKRGWKRWVPAPVKKVAKRILGRR